MEGDLAPLQQLVELKKRYPNVLLYVDEAHSFGLFGEDGLGLCKELGVHEDVDFLVGTLSKAIGSQGAFLICSPEVKEYLVNFMRPLIFSTALPPVNVTFSMYVIGLLVCIRRSPYVRSLITATKKSKIWGSCLRRPKFNHCFLEIAIGLLGHRIFLAEPVCWLCKLGSRLYRKNRHVCVWL